MTLDEIGKRIDAAPLDASLHRIAAQLLVKGQRLEDGLGEALLAVGLDPNNAEGHAIAGAIWDLLGDVESAREALEWALTLSPYMPAARWNYGLNCLKRGLWEEGWAGYRWGQAAGPRTKRTCGPEWDGSTVGTLFVWSEQGFGDTLQFVRFVAEARSRCGCVLLEVQPSLARYLQPLADRVFPKQTDYGVPYPWDAHCSVMDLPGILGGEPSGEPYLPIPSTRGSGTGICWHGGPGDLNWRRSCPGELARAAFPDAVILQQEENPSLTDWQATAEIVAGLERVITVDTAIAHLSAGMGIPTWIMLPFAGEWRWGMDPTRTIWYDSARLYRQAEPGDWAGTIQRIQHDLNASSTAL